MEATYKRSLKAKAKRYTILAFSFVGFGFLFLIGTIIVRSHVEGQWSTLTAVFAMCGFLVPVLTGAVIGIASGTFFGELRAYMSSIKEYRVRRAFQKFMDYISADDLDMAITIYNGYIPMKHPTRDYAYSILIMLMSRSTDPDLQKRGMEKVQGMREFYDPSKVQL